MRFSNCSAASGPQLRIVVSDSCSKPPVLLAPGKFLFKQQLKGLVSTLLSRPKPEVKRSDGIFPLAKGENVLPADVCAEFANGFRIDGGASVTKVDLRNFKADSPFDAFQMFRNCRNLVEIDLAGMGRVEILNAESMFDFCFRVRRINLGNLDFGLAQNMKSMFAKCPELEEINLGSSRPHSARTADHMFDGCRALRSIDFSGWDGVRITSAAHMFSRCEHLVRLDLSGLNLRELTNVANMFEGCSSLASIDLSGMNLDGVEHRQLVANMFKGCGRLREVVLRGCTSLTGDIVAEELHCLTAANQGMKVKIVGCKTQPLPQGL